MATSTINAITATTGAVSGDEMELQLAGGGASRKSTLGNLQAAIVGNLISIAGVNAGHTTTKYTFGVKDAGLAGTAGQDEFWHMGYNDAGVNSGEPTSTIHGEVDYNATARGVGAQRTMETYLQYAGAGATGAPRPWFWAFEPGNTDTGETRSTIANDPRGGGPGMILYGLTRVGLNRYSQTDSSAGGGLAIVTDDYAYNPLLGAFDIDGVRLSRLRTAPDIEAMVSTVTAANPMVFTAVAGHNLQPGSQIELYKLGGGSSNIWTSHWKTIAITSISDSGVNNGLSGPRAGNKIRVNCASTAGIYSLAGTNVNLTNGFNAAIAGVAGSANANGKWSVGNVNAGYFDLNGSTFTAIAGAGGTWSIPVYTLVTGVSGNSITTNLDNTSLGVVTGGTYGWMLARPNSFGSGSNWTPSFYGLQVNTARPNSLAFNMEVAGTSCYEGKVYIYDPRVISDIKVNPSVSDFKSEGLLNFLVDNVVDGTYGRLQLMSFRSLGAGSPNNGSGAFGFLSNAGDATSNRYLGFGGFQSTDTNFTVANACLSMFIDGVNFATTAGIGIAGGNPQALAKLAIGPGTTTMALINLSTGGSAKNTSPVNGDIWYDGSKAAGQKWRIYSEGAETYIHLGA